MRNVLPIIITPTEADPRWQRVLARDRGADGQFWYSVATTGVYCRPSCPSRTARPSRVAFHDSPALARAAGFRACRRCDPDGPPPEATYAMRVVMACRLIDQSEQAPLLADLAAAAGLSARHFHRLFKRITGLTPRQYAAAQRSQRICQALQHASSVTEAIYASGFNSSGRFYENSTQILGMTPTRYRAGGRHEVIHFAVGEASLGSILVASSDKGVVAILLGDDPNALLQNLQDRFPNARLIGGNKDYEDLIAKIVGFIEAPALGLNLPLDIRGTAFQRRVWEALRKIPMGETASYSEIAARIGSPSSARAVAGACAANTIALAIPCHRVVRSDGGLSGYAWGVERKRALIEHEAATR